MTSGTLAYLSQGVVLLLAEMFAWSGVAKARRPLQAALAISNFHVTNGPNVWAARAVAGGELVLSVGLFISVWLAPMAAVLLFLGAGCLAVFAALIGRSLGRGERFACMCFGSDRPLSLLSLCRAIALVVLTLASAIAYVTQGIRAPSAGVYALLLSVCGAILALLAVGFALRVVASRMDPFDAGEPGLVDPFGIPEPSRMP